ncbi:glycine cleavage system aminomethyltransferase GcvT [Staphylothermus hellenicus]|uniref:glycine cleavage system aminomethyltransferase GcvT n=1 Tax=Staphylothermus hellenicus TaxID=84599 RepID=UPI00069C78B0|nr:glycine cleavage system aminomethyltransferase GcvT [Staphylothermus hellenicus]
MAKIPLLNYHVEKLGAEPGFFGDWEVPMRYTSSIEEHLAVRRDVGVFDVSHMGRIRLKGSDVFELIQYVYTKDLSKVKTGWMSGPTLALNQWARVKDDEMLYKIRDDEWLLVPNALVREKMLSYLRSIINNRQYKVVIEDLTFKYSMIAIQGPKSPDIMEKIGLKDASDLKPLQFITNIKLNDIKLFLISRSGWTGEDGFEVWGDHSSIAKLLDILVKEGVKPAGIIARDTLRMEMGFVLGDHEYGEDPVKYPCAISLRYGLGAITWSKKGYVGEEALRACLREGVRWVRMGIKMSKKNARIIPREHMPVYVEDQVVGWITSGTYSPILRRGIAQAYIDARYAIEDLPVKIMMRNRFYEGKIVDFPFITK